MTGRSRPAAILAPIDAPTPKTSEPPPLRVQCIASLANGRSVVRAVELSWTIRVFFGSTCARCASSTAGCTIAFFARDHELRELAPLAALARPRRGLVGVKPRQRRGDAAERLGQFALRRDVERIVAAHGQRVRADLDCERLPGFS